jgi:hypothetical protein
VYSQAGASRGGRSPTPIMIGEKAARMALQAAA